MVTHKRLAVLGAIASLLASPARGQAPGGNAHELSGIVLDPARNPIAGAALTVQQRGGSPLMLRTGSDGKFRITGLSSDSVIVIARRLGYTPRTGIFHPGLISQRPEFEITLEPLPEALGAVNVTGTEGRLERFYQHRKENASGQFIDRQQIEKQGARYASDLFRSVSGATLRPSHRFGNVIRLRGCRPRIWVDGVPLHDAELDDVTSPNEIAGIEIYLSAPLVPAEYMDRQSRGCGAVIVWTRID